MRRRVVFLLALSLAGCAANVVRLEHAGTVSTQSAAVVTGAKAYVAAVQERRREAAITLVASDPLCRWGAKLVVDMQWSGKTALCDLTGVPANRQWPIDLRPIQPEALKALTEAIAGIATYQAALSEIIDEKPAQAKQDIDDALTILTTASSDINRIAGSKAIDLGPLTADRAKAISDLIGTLIELRQSQLKVDKVRAITSGTQVSTLLDGLTAGLTHLSDLQDANSATYALLGLKTAYVKEVNTANFTERSDLIRQIALADDAFNDAQLGRIGTLTEAIAKLRDEDGKLRDALAGKFSPAERQRIARENIKLVFGLLSKVAALFPAL